MQAGFRGISCVNPILHDVSIVHFEQAWKHFTFKR